MAAADAPELPNPNEKLVKVFDSDQESEVMVVRGLLESADIEVITTNLDAPQDILPGVGGLILQVRAEQSEEALKLIEEYRSGGEQAAEDAVTGETTAEPKSEA